MNNSQSPLAKTVDIITNDVELGKQVPGAPFALVSLSYVVILLLSAVSFAVGMWLFS